MTPLLNLIMQQWYYSFGQPANGKTSDFSQKSDVSSPGYNGTINRRGGMNQQELLTAVQDDWANWQNVLARVGEQRMTEPGASGAWSVKDIIAHITFFENEMVGLLQTRVLAGSDLWALPQDERNRVIYEQNRSRALGDVLAESAQVHARMVRLLDGLSDADLLEAARFKEMPADWLPWRIIAENTFEHYRDHAAIVRAWLDAH
jgi:hypothetical protein